MKKQIVIELVPGRIGVLVLDGAKAIETRHIPIEIEDDPVEWAKTLRRSAVSLRALVDELRVGDSPTTVLYRSPTQFVQLSGYAVRSAAQVVEAATMSCAATWRALTPG